MNAPKLQKQRLDYAENIQKLLQTMDKKLNTKTVILQILFIKIDYYVILLNSISTSNKANDNKTMCILKCV